MNRSRSRRQITFISFVLEFLRNNDKRIVVCNETDVLFIKRLVNEELERKKVRETNIGEELLEEIANLSSLRKHRYMK